MTTLVGTLVTATVRPFDSEDTYPTHEEQYGLGGYRSVIDQATKDLIPADRRVQGMLVRTLDDDKLWELADDLETWYEMVRLSKQSAVVVQGSCQEISALINLVAALHDIGIIDNQTTE